MGSKLQRARAVAAAAPELPWWDGLEPRVGPVIRLVAIHEKVNARSTFVVALPCVEI